jgi:hypothetical protein
MLNLQRLAFLKMGNIYAGLIHDMDASIALRPECVMVFQQFALSITIRAKVAL